MKKILMLMMIHGLWLQPLFAQHINQTIMDTTLQQEVLIDTCDRIGLSGPVFGAFFQQEYATYSPSEEVIQQIGQQLNVYRITIVMGSWCGDSQEQVPRFLKILDQLHFPEDQVTVICVDRKKKTIHADIQPLAVQLVPTFIFYKDNTEAGRIIETPSETLEKDLLNILLNILNLNDHK